MTLTEGSLMNGAPDFEVALAPDIRALASMRREVIERLGAHRVVPAAVDDLLLILTELCTNAIQATAPGNEPVLVRVRIGAVAVTLEVENAGLPFNEDAATAHRRAGTDTERGRGLVIVRALTDELTVRHHDGRCTVRVVMALG